MRRENACLLCGQTPGLPLPLPAKNPDKMARKQKNNDKQTAAPTLSTTAATAFQGKENTSVRAGARLATHKCTRYLVLLVEVVNALLAHL